MKIEELIIDGFKSYATRTVISDWDPQFNAITGLNGSGKSNILDAICFVLGISSMTTVRASSLQDLIYKRGQAGVTKASVTIVFDNADKSNTPIGFTNSPKISVTRQVVLGGTSKYLINGHRAPQQSVLQLFQSVQLNINNPNFLIMQGKITKVLNMKPTEILSLIEEAAGTKMFEDRKEKAERTMAKKEAKLQENRALLEEEIEPKLEKLRNEKRVFLEFQETQADLEKTERIVNAFDFDYMVTKNKSLKKNFEMSKIRSNELNELIIKISNEIASLNEDLEETKAAKQKEIDEDGKLVQLEKKEDELLNEISRMNASLSICLENYEETKKKLDSTEELLKSNKAELSIKLHEYKLKEKEYKSLNEKLKIMKETHKIKEELLSTLETGISSTGATDGGYNEQLIAAKQKHNEAQISIKKLRMKIDHLEKEHTSNQPKLDNAIKENNASREYAKECQDTCAELSKELFKFGYDPKLVENLKRQETSLKQEIYKLDNESTYLGRKVANIDFTYSKPYASFDAHSVKGVAAQLFELPEKSYDSATALQICAGGRLFNVVVDNEKTAAALLERGKLRKRVTIIPLNKIFARELSNDTLTLAMQLAPNKVELALHLITYDDDVSKAMQFIFGNSLVCEDAETAKKVTFHPQIRTRSITLEGDVYDPEGTLSGGSRNNRNSILIDIQKYNTARKRIMSLEKDLLRLQSKLQEQESAFQKSKSLQNTLNLATHKSNLAQRNLENNPGIQLIKRNEEITKEIEEYQSVIKGKTEFIAQCEIEIQNIQKDIREFSNDKGSKLKQLKQEIDGLSKQVGSLENDLESIYDSYQTLQLDTEQLTNDISTGEESMELSSAYLRKLESEKSDIEQNLKSIQDNLNRNEVLLNEEKRRLIEINEELKELDTIIREKSEARSNYELELQALKNNLNKFKNGVDGLGQKIAELLASHDWLEDEAVVTNIVQQNDGLDLEQYRERVRHLQEKFQDMKRKVNPNIMSMIENVEKKEFALKTMIKTIEKDKVKIQETIEKLNEYKKETLIKTWQKVTNDFGNVFADLLPNSFAKLVPSEGKEVTDGLEVKVKLGNIWKESLVELSGGQRSLIALSLIMALLQFRPAPMYILDEVDAALDLSHTQNIGHLIKTRFKGSQFIVVSLKEGMFTNANRVFRTRFQDGTSVVSIM